MLTREYPESFYFQNEIKDNQNLHQLAIQMRYHGGSQVDACIIYAFINDFIIYWQYKKCTRNWNLNAKVGPKTVSNGRNVRVEFCGAFQRYGYEISKSLNMFHLRFRV